MQTMSTKLTKTDPGNHHQSAYHRREKKNKQPTDIRVINPGILNVLFHTVEAEFSGSSCAVSDSYPLFSSKILQFLLSSWCQSTCHTHQIGCSCPFFYLGSKKASILPSRTQCTCTVASHPGENLSDTKSPISPKAKSPAMSEVTNLHRCSDCLPEAPLFGSRQHLQGN